MPKHVKSIAVTAVAAGMLLLAASWSTAAGGTRQTSGFPMLRTIMRDMGNNMQVIADAIAREDWARVAKTAPLLAARPKPSMAEKVRLLGFLGTNAGEFRGYDKETRHAAQALELAATRGMAKPPSRRLPHWRLVASDAIGFFASRSWKSSMRSPDPHLRGRPFPRATATCDPGTWRAAFNPMRPFNSHPSSERPAMSGRQPRKPTNCWFFVRACAHVREST